MKITYKKFLFIQSGILDEDQIRTCIMEGIKQLNFVCDKSDLIINVVKNKSGKHFGHTYAWINNNKIYNALIGLNIDGTERYEEVEDEDWKEPEIPIEEALEGVTDWAEEEEIEERYTVPYKKISLEPLIILPGIQYNSEQKNKTNSEIGFIDLFPVSLTNYETYDNYIFSKNVPSWLTEDIVFNYFKKYETDISNKYPKVTIKNFSTGNKLKVIFSPRNSNLAMFVLKIVKKLEMSDGSNKELIFFSQGKNKST